MRPSINEFDYHRITLLADDTPEGKGLFLGRIIPQDKIKMKQIVKWMQYCIRWHGAGCEETLSSLSSGRISKLRVIDTWRLCIVDESSECIYLTLSYVWGSATVFKLTSTNLDELATPGALKKVWRQLPRTIQDSITLTSTLHERYLWIDSLCIIQDSDADKAHYIPYMDSIYDRAFLTIAAATGDSADAGLPGVRKGSRGCSQIIEEVLPSVRLSSIRHLRDALDESVYESRAWT
ncbi:HET-domain-containing protein [Mytilinidion resinicola]|uniref:HET-domain-containing protein n=1 Tax=Mytilinidion resinicola TaxID=574789 RepID=A0A6A6YQ67_9PEZI|nr:HET-domain-containing protein [Mytilinidion resinicola]KAF2811046.1 HET-domain-containing protein [Mytilinidion resinicola]